MQEFTIYILKILLDTWAIASLHFAAVLEVLKIVGVSSAWIGSLLFWVISKEKRKVHTPAY